MTTPKFKAGDVVVRNDNNNIKKLRYTLTIVGVFGNEYQIQHSAKKLGTIDEYSINNIDEDFRLETKLDKALK